MLKEHERIRNAAVRQQCWFYALTRICLRGYIGRVDGNRPAMEHQERNDED